MGEAWSEELREREAHVEERGSIHYYAEVGLVDGRIHGRRSYEIGGI